MIKHGASHGLAVLVCTITSFLLVETFRPLIPNALGWVDSFSLKIICLLQLDVQPAIISVILLGTCLAIFWGIAFKALHKD